VVEWLQEITKGARQYYCPTFDIETFLDEVRKAAREAAERGLYCASYVFEPPYHPGNSNRLALWDTLQERLQEIYGAMVTPSLLPSGDAWVVFVAWYSADKIVHCPHGVPAYHFCEACSTDTKTPEEKLPSPSDSEPSP